MSGANKPAMKRIGYFGEAGYTTIGEPYKTKVVETMPRYKGAQFQTNPLFVGDTRRGCLGNGLFGKAPALFNVRLPRLRRSHAPVLRVAAPRPIVPSAVKNTLVPCPLSCWL
jgi:hypothetical protein